MKLQGADADKHELPAYDGYMALAGFAWTLSLVTNFAETGKIRHRGNFEGRSLVKAQAISSGSVIAEFIVSLATNSIIIASAEAIGVGLVTNFMYDLLKRTIQRNVGAEVTIATPELAELEKTRGGDLEALVAAVEPAIRFSHSVIGTGVNIINIYGNNNKISGFDADSKAYVSRSIEDKTILEKDLSVASFNANSDYGSIYNTEYGRTIPIKLTKNTLDGAKAVLSWGLHQYASGTGKKVSLKFFRVLSFDGTPKQYIVANAEIPENN